VEEEDGWEAQAWRARELAADGKLEEAEALARAVPMSSDFTGYGHERCEAFLFIAAEAARRGQQSRAEALLRDLEACAGSLRTGGIWEEADVLARTGSLWAMLGMPREATRLWEATLHAIGLSRHAEDVDCQKIANHVRGLLSNGWATRGKELLESWPSWWGRSKGGRGGAA
jgi:hypothetical protein